MQGFKIIRFTDLTITTGAITDHRGFNREESKEIVGERVSKPLKRGAITHSQRTFQPTIPGAFRDKRFSPHSRKDAAITRRGVEGGDKTPTHQKQMVGSISAVNNSLPLQPALIKWHYFLRTQGNFRAIDKRP